MISSDDRTVTNRTVHFVMGINMERERDILGLWVDLTGSESPKTVAHVGRAPRCAFELCGEEGHLRSVVAATGMKLRAV